MNEADVERAVWSWVRLRHSLGAKHLLNDSDVRLPLPPSSTPATSVSHSLMTSSLASSCAPSRVQRVEGHES
jgi:hypothetical protein